MTTEDAFYFAMTKVNELKESGIKVTIKPSALRSDKDTIKKYDSPDRIKPALWVNIHFKVLKESHGKEILEMANYLGMCGMYFDTGGCCGSRDWEFDWSFIYKKGEENWELRHLRSEVEDMIKTMETNG